jgi:hypothetical protein
VFSGVHSGPADGPSPTQNNSYPHNRRFSSNMGCRAMDTEWESGGVGWSSVMLQTSWLV